MLQKDPGIERVVRFVGFLASQLPDGRKEEALIFCEGLLGWLLGLAPAKDKTVRARTCQLLREIISALPQDAGLDEARAYPPPRLVWCQTKGVSHAARSPTRACPLSSRLV